MESLARSRSLALMLDHDAVLRCATHQAASWPSSPLAPGTASTGARHRHQPTGSIACSAWEKIGGSAFSCDDMVVPDDPQDITLDLSLFEPASSKDETALFSGCLFSPELPGVVPAGPPSAQRSWASSAQVVPTCCAPVPFGPTAPIAGMVPFPLLRPMGVPGLPMPYSHTSHPTGSHQPISNVFSFESDDDVLEVPVVPNHMPKTEDVLQEMGPVASLSSCASDAGAVPDVTSPSTAHGVVHFQQLPMHHNGITSSSSTGVAAQRGRHAQQPAHTQQQQQQLRPAGEGGGLAPDVAACDAQTRVWEGRVARLASRSQLPAACRWP